MRTRTTSRCALLLAAALPVGLYASALRAQESPSNASDAGQQPATAAEPGTQIEYPQPRKSLTAQTLEDAEAYYTAPLHWNGRDWALFGGALAAVAVSHHYDTQARNHYVAGSSSPLGPQKSDELKDIAPTAALLLGTWGYASLIGSRAGESETWNMVESGGLSMVSAYALKYMIRRPGPNETTDANHWFGGGRAFPSEHTTAAFAVGTVLAESGNPEFRWLRRTIGYGLGFGTAYLRMKHNQHWLSDTIAGAALGAATAHFVMNRSSQREDDEDSSAFSLVPTDGGVMLAYTAEFTN
ncbi:MAG TPA: phosphatase PAP2 family protein [Steroidobacteraceae bacterium]|nr:phosphatase PAP2 family protein [Steroidobacteraceae bacterium]